MEALLLPDWSILAIVCPLVFLGGMIDAVAGGGGLIALPAYLLAGLPPHLAIGTNRVSSVIGMAVSAGRYFRSGYMDFALAVPAVVCALAGGAVGAKLGLLVPAEYFRTLLIILLPIAACVVIFRKTLSDVDVPMGKSRRVLLIGLSAFAAGLYDGFYGPGAGTFMLMAFTGIAGLSVQSASGEMKCANLASGVAALIMYAGTPGVTDWTLGLIAAIFGIAGHWCGAGLLIHRGAKIVRPVMLVVIALLFVKLVWDYVLG